MSVQLESCQSQQPAYLGSYGNALWFHVRHELLQRYFHRVGHLFILEMPAMDAWPGAQRSSLRCCVWNSKSRNGLESYHQGTRQRMVARSRMLPTNFTMLECEDMGRIADVSRDCRHFRPSLESVSISCPFLLRYCGVAPLVVLFGTADSASPRLFLWRKGDVLVVSFRNQRN